MAISSDKISDEKTTANHLIDVAGEVFAEKGPSATVRDICGRAGCSVAAINYYFGDKQQLYLRCVQTACEQKQRLFPLPKLEPSSGPAGEAASLATRTPEDWLRDFLRAMTARIAGQTNLSWYNTLMMREVISPSPQVAAMLSTHFRRDFELLDHHLGKLLGTKLDCADTRRQLSLQILARCMFLRTGKQLRQMLDIHSEASELPESYADEVCDSILLQIRALAAS